MNISQIESNIQNVLQGVQPESFIYDFILAYGLPKATVARLQKGGLNLSKNEGELAWKKKMFFKTLTPQEDTLIRLFRDVPSVFERMKTHKDVLKHDPRFIMLTDFDVLLAFDTKMNEGLNIPLTDLPKHFDFFLPLAGMEKAQVQMENPADVKAAEKMGKLYAQIKKDNPDETAESTHNLNIFLSRLLFCFFAEDTGIFAKNIFTQNIESHTQQDGSDLNPYLDTLFEVMNTPPQYRTQSAAFLGAFPYVNGGLFKHKHPAPVFTRRSRDILIECGGLDWAAINPDIFGSMIQAVVSSDDRGSLGMHYTSVPNIMKVIKPLFLDELTEEFEAAKGNLKKLNALLQRLWRIKIFDPACGSGNFLIIAYKELRKLEMDVFKEIDRVNQAYSNQFSGIALSNFYGIEIDDFAHEIAILSLWLAEHQMNQSFLAAFGRAKPALPLMEIGNIVQGNATRLNWAEICPHTVDEGNPDTSGKGGEVFVLGNPPYLGSSMQSAEQKEDMAFVFKGIKDYKNLDYIACWFLNGAKYIQNQKAQFAFVSTNSICQGEQVALLWSHIFYKNLEIGFAHTSFKWKNNAKSNAMVSVVIIGVFNSDTKSVKYIFLNDKQIRVTNINAYLATGNNIIVEKRSKPLSKLNEMTSGLKAGDDGNLILNEIEKQELINSYPLTKSIIKNYVGADELMNGGKRFCLWITNDDVSYAYTIPILKNRFEKCREFRLSSKKQATNRKALFPHQFDETSFVDSESIIIPQTGSERREYIPIGFLSSNTVISNAARAIYNAKPYLFSVISSRIHITWVRAVAGRLKMDMQYSNTLCYNTFPMPPLSKTQEQELEKHVYRILEEREAHSEKTLAQLYDPDKMPDGLREAHRQNDLAVERIYRSRPFETDEERLEHLFKLYEQMIAAEKERQGEINFETTPTKKKKK
jgi:hypothetical protein